MPRAPPSSTTKWSRSFCALAQQCFLNEYVFAQSDEEIREAGRLREALLQKAIVREAKLHPPCWPRWRPTSRCIRYPSAKSLLAARVARLRSAICCGSRCASRWRRPKIGGAIPALTPITDKVSREVRDQYEENPYPRWTLNPLAGFAGALREHGRPVGGGDAGGPPARHSDRRVRHRRAPVRRGAEIAASAHSCGRSQPREPCLRASKDSAKKAYAISNMRKPTF